LSGQAGVPIAVIVNGARAERVVEPRLLLSDFLRHDLGLTGTHVGCEHGVCGACTILLDGAAVRSCLIFAVQADGHEVQTVEGLAAAVGGDVGDSRSGNGADDAEALHPLQAAFREAHALQCGFCTPGFLMTLVPFLAEHPSPTEGEIREALSGNLCRCTGYKNIVDAVVLAAREMAAAAPPLAGGAPASAAAPASAGARRSTRGSGA
jgi:aerobic-type carbon monoxide dehydrogenase small subunit (CoxS/CutS family)